ncbi:hypothetical protein [Streptomyces sp. NPDC005283]|uniref:hypothetical protein n=1 Tax=Streptomyces sp. NPDC005283 TaxID=3156871 RepID=UPI00345440CB
MSARCPDDGSEPAEQISLEARATGHGQTYQVVHGKQRIVHHHHYHGDGLPAPLPLPDLQLWIARLAADYRALVKAGDGPSGRREAAGHGRQLDVLERELAGSAGRRNGKDPLRRLLAAGAAQYLDRASRVPTDPLPEQLMVDLAVFALWPVIEAPALPVDWQDHLAALTTPRLAVLVSQVRQLGIRGKAVAPDAFGRALADKPFAHGVLALLEDLADPRGGGACLTAISLAGRVPPPPQKASAKAVLGWLLAGGTVAIEGPDLAEHAWHWLQDMAGGATPRPRGGSGDIDDNLEKHRGGAGGRHAHLPGQRSAVGPPGSGTGAGHSPGAGSGGGFDFLNDLFS